MPTLIYNINIYTFPPTIISSPSGSIYFFVPFHSSLPVKLRKVSNYKRFL